MESVGSLVLSDDSDPGSNLLIRASGRMNAWHAPTRSLADVLIRKITTIRITPKIKVIQILIK